MGEAIVEPGYTRIHKLVSCGSDTAITIFDREMYDGPLVLVVRLYDDGECREADVYLTPDEARLFADELKRLATYVETEQAAEGGEDA
jgi:hypothetical protein